MITEKEIETVFIWKNKTRYNSRTYITAATVHCEVNGRKCLKGCSSHSKVMFAHHDVKFTCLRLNGDIGTQSREKLARHTAQITYQCKRDQIAVLC